MQHSRLCAPDNLHQPLMATTTAPTERAMQLYIAHMTVVAIPRIVHTGASPSQHRTLRLPYMLHSHRYTSWVSPTKCAIHWAWHCNNGQAIRQANNRHAVTKVSLYYCGIGYRVNVSVYASLNLRRLLIVYGKYRVWDPVVVLKAQVCCSYCM
jgi:hypothetical protein